MKRILAIALIAAFAFAATANVAKAQFGIKGGIYTTNLSKLNKDDFRIKDNIGYQLGILYSHHITPGVVIQPELLYVARKTIVEAKGATSTTSTSDKFEVQYLQVPVSLQYGFNLIVARPYVQVVPYLSYMIGKNIKFTDGTYNIEGCRKDVNKLNGGLGLGFGADLWKFQFNVRYNWDITKAGHDDIGNRGSSISYKEWRASKQKGLEVSLAFIF